MRTAFAPAMFSFQGSIGSKRVHVCAHGCAHVFCVCMRDERQRGDEKNRVLVHLPDANV
jgi:hypothetical protein